jgi:acetolactate synthase-1/2/3 large subunit
MKVSDYIAEYLVNLGVTDVFGIPGGVILDLIYAFDAKEGITPHLSYHEQCAGLAACGYAQSSGKLGIAYATRGPGFTNLITAIADAYYDSIPTLFITAHSASCPPEGMRVIADQEIDTCSMVSNITKYTARIDLVEDFLPIFNDACRIAMEGRKGPVFLDIATNLLKKELKYQEKDKDNKSELVTFNRTIATNLVKNIQSAKRPVLLLGDGINQRNIANKVRAFISSAEIPVISSRFSHDIASGSPFYYGYIGSHAVRTANFILSKCDLIISLGNRLHFPPTSESFSCILDHAKILRFDIDDNEFIRDIKNSQCYKCDVADLINELPLQTEVYGNHSSWIEICNRLDKELHYADINPAVDKIANILGKISRDFIVVNDVGNNEFWVSRASVLLGISNRVMYSKSFGVLGCGLGKAIGAHYGTNKPVICFIGDQGLLMNIQELQ